MWLANQRGTTISDPTLEALATIRHELEDYGLKNYGTITKSNKLRTCRIGTEGAPTDLAPTNPFDIIERARISFLQKSERWEGKPTLGRNELRRTHTVGVGATCLPYFYLNLNKLRKERNKRIVRKQVKFRRTVGPRPRPGPSRPRLNAGRAAP
jgi:hypothetical protein